MGMHLEINNPDTEAKLTAEAHLRGIDFETLIDLAIHRLPSLETTEPARVKTAGEIIRAVGFVEGLPPDLSSNPGKYMKGFGQTKARLDAKP